MIRIQPSGGRRDDEQTITPHINSYRSGRYFSTQGSWSAADVSVVVVMLKVSPTVSVLLVVDVFVAYCCCWLSRTVAVGWDESFGRKTGRRDAPKKNLRKIRERDKHLMWHNNLIYERTEIWHL